MSISCTVDWLSSQVNSTVISCASNDRDHFKCWLSMKWLENGQWLTVISSSDITLIHTHNEGSYTY